MGRDRDRDRDRNKNGKARAKKRAKEETPPTEITESNQTELL